ncbi:MULTISPECIES: MFS transporter [Bifidobacterium]|uniref:MFS transporter n=1 Tax=Bifidobacterium TaxID=1678 RepID=UPI001BDC0CDA|nr:MULTISPECIES: MFS transporter [Bifidobacterium]MBT1160797.1 MFS transporter [Bifidobacterium sp. SO1]MBW3077797.1 MFS transporter [Bifidobacterium simiiventris]
MTDNDTINNRAGGRTPQKPSASQSKTAVALAIGLVTSLFFVWGLTMNLVNALNTPIGNYMQLNSAQTSLLQVAYYSAYFVMAIPAGLVARRFGYKGGIICGLALFVIGSFIVAPATGTSNYVLFLLAMFVIALGAASLEANCNPYITKLGDEKGESFRLNLAQSFNGIGTVVGPLILGQILSDTVAPGKPGFDEAKTKFLSDTRGIYLTIGIALAVLLIIFVAVKLPTPPGDDDDVASDASSNQGSGSFANLLRRPYFLLGVFAQFVFLGIQTGGMAMFSAYALKHWGAGITTGLATTLLSVMALLFTLGRFLTTPLMTRFDPAKILGWYMLIGAALMVVVFLGLGRVSVIALLVSFLFVSIGYPTIFSLTLRGATGAAAKTGSSIVVMSIVGGAVITFVLGVIQDAAGIEMAMLAMVPLFLYDAWYAFFGSRIGRD